jgi:hypothetical protein
LSVHRDTPAHRRKGASLKDDGRDLQGRPSNDARFGIGSDLRFPCAVGWTSGLGHRDFTPDGNCRERLLDPPEK